VFFTTDQTRRPPGCPPTQPLGAAPTHLYNRRREDLS
jgi:hypothetical protein